jgi:cytochrome oxidase Cu insertion factor (SCO1/SenC/PrrC family)
MGTPLTSSPPWLRLVRRGAFGLSLLLVGFVAGILIARQRHGANTLADLGMAPHYQLTNQLGQKISSQAFAGKVQIVTFLFPYCTTYCPLITAHLIGLEHVLNDAGLRKRVEIVAFNVAPVDTGPKQMREFLAQYGWNPRDPHWQYLTGTRAQIRRVVTLGFHVAYERVMDKQGADGAVLSDPGQTPQLSVANPLAARAKPDYDVSHNDAIEIVGPGGHIRKIYDDADVVSNQRLLRAVEAVLRKD